MNAVHLNYCDKNYQNFKNKVCKSRLGKPRTLILFGDT